MTPNPDTVTEDSAGGPLQAEVREALARPRTVATESHREQATV
jgi:hypothetical protein